MTTQMWATRRPPHVDGTTTQQRALRSAVERLDLRARERVVLGVLIAHADGAGFCWLKVETITGEAACSESTAHRALAALTAAGLADSYPFMQRRQRENIYRLGRVLRDAAGLAEVDVDDALGLRLAPLVDTPQQEPRSEAGLAPLTGTPQLPMSSLQIEGCHSSRAGTPRTRNEEQAGNDYTLGSTSEVDPARETDDDAFLAALFPAKEVAPTPFVPPASAGDDDAVPEPGDEGFTDWVRARHPKGSPERLALFDAHRDAMLAGPTLDEREFIGGLIDTLGATLTDDDDLRERPLCRYPSHRGSDWRNPSGRVVCGVCHPPVPGAVRDAA